MGRLSLSYNVPQSTLVIGQSGCGILEIQDNASITQRLYVGNNSSSHGAVYQNGGVMHNWGGCASDGRIGFSGYGYYELNSGTFTNMGYFHLGRNVNSVGILRQTGGAFEMGNVYAGILGLSRGGTAVVHTVGGTFNTASYLSVGEASDNGLQTGLRCSRRTVTRRSESTERSTWPTAQTCWRSPISTAARSARR